MHEFAHSEDVGRLFDSPAACRERLLALQDEIASIRLQIATADLRRQAARRPVDPDWFHRAKTALRLKQQEVARIQAHLATRDPGGAGRRRDRFQDALIEVVRAECDDARWARLLSRARALQASREADHG